MLKRVLFFVVLLFMYVTAAEADDLLGMRLNIADSRYIDFFVVYDAKESRLPSRLPEYFLSILALPKDDLWVNLLPDGQDKVMPLTVSQTPVGEVLLDQDLELKKYASSLLSRETETGKRFWQEYWRLSQEKFGVGPANAQKIDLASRVWILPGKAQISIRENAVMLEETSLRVMLESDYYHKTGDKFAQLKDQLYREIVLPVIEHEVNFGPRFEKTRQVYHALILGEWYKQNVKNGVLAKSYVDRGKILGISIPSRRSSIFSQYVQSLKQGVFSEIGRDADVTGRMIPRRYVAGGIPLAQGLKIEVVSSPASYSNDYYSDFFSDKPSGHLLKTKVQLVKNPQEVPADASLLTKLVARMFPQKHNYARPVGIVFLNYEERKDEYFSVDANGGDKFYIFDDPEGPKESIQLLRSAGWQKTPYFVFDFSFVRKKREEIKTGKQILTDDENDFLLTAFFTDYTMSVSGYLRPYFEEDELSAPERYIHNKRFDERLKKIFSGQIDRAIIEKKTNDDVRYFWLTYPPPLIQTQYHVDQIKSALERGVAGYNLITKGNMKSKYFIAKSCWLEYRLLANLQNDAWSDYWDLFLEALTKMNLPKKYIYRKVINTKYGKLRIKNLAQHFEGQMSPDEHKRFMDFRKKVIAEADKNGALDLATDDKIIQMWIEDAPKDEVQYDVKYVPPSYEYETVSWQEPDGEEIVYKHDYYTTWTETVPIYRTVTEKIQKAVIPRRLVVVVNIPPPSLSKASSPVGGIDFSSLYTANWQGMDYDFINENEEYDGATIIVY